MVPVPPGALIIDSLPVLGLSSAATSLVHTFMAYMSFPGTSKAQSHVIQKFQGIVGVVCLISKKQNVESWNYW